MGYSSCSSRTVDTKTSKVYAMRSQIPEGEGKDNVVLFSLLQSHTDFASLSENGVRKEQRVKGGSRVQRISNTWTAVT